MTVTYLEDICGHVTHPWFHQYIIPDLADWIGCTAPYFRNYHDICSTVLRDNETILRHIAREVGHRCAGGDDLYNCLMNILEWMEYQEYLTLGIILGL